MKSSSTSIALLFTVILLAATACTEQTPPLVYSVENTGVDCPEPPLPGFDELPNVRPLTDPFEKSDGSGRSTKFKDWPCRRAEISKEIQHYEIGEKPARAQNITATYENDTLTVNVTANGNTLTLRSPILLPEGEGPFPAVIGMGSPNGSIPADIFTDRNIARIPFIFSQVMAHTQVRGEQPINELYPDLVEMGAYSAWPWGVSRLIDGLELVAADLPIDLGHLAVTGCSFAGKMALFAGAFDERVALTISQESGGGGAAAWRVSETLGNVEKLGATNFSWFMESERQFARAVPKLPFDHHELMAMVAPRALLVLGNPSQEWLADESGYVSSRAAREVWKTFDIGDRMGFTFVGDHPHCRLPDVQRPEVGAFIDRFLLGDENANTDIQTNPFDTVNDERWFAWWGTGDSDYPDFGAYPANAESLTFETECAEHGSEWELFKNADASNGAYVTIKAGLNSASEAPTGPESAITIPFTVAKDSTYYVFGRVNAPNAQDDSIWLRFDDGDFLASNGLGTVGWQWVMIARQELTAGDHTLTITYREDGTMLDKINITSVAYGPDVMGEEDAANRCDM
jgi:hypothetical protein